MAAAGSAHVGAAAIVVGGAEEENGVVWEFHADGAGGFFVVLLL